MKATWIRVNKKNPCIICGRFDWDTYSVELKLACCMRVKSDRPAKNGGYLHPLDGARVKFIPRPRPAPSAPIDCQKIWEGWHKRTDPTQLVSLADRLGVTVFALQALDCVWADPHRAFAFPMRDFTGKMVGLRLRAYSGEKWSVTGSHNGLFYSLDTMRDFMDQKTLWVTEGATDAAALFTLDLFAVGRPSCLGCEAEISKLISLGNFRDCIIVADQDAPGQRGAEKLQATLKVPSLVFTPGAKDLRQWVSFGGTRQLLQSTLADLVWTHPKL